MCERGRCGSKNLEVGVGVLSAIVVPLHQSVHGIEVTSQNRLFLLGIHNIDVDTVEETAVSTNANVFRQIPGANNRSFGGANTIVGVNVFGVDLGVKLGGISGSDTLVGTRGNDCVCASVVVLFRIVYSG